MITWKAYKRFVGLKLQLKEAQHNHSNNQLLIPATFFFFWVSIPETYNLQIRMSVGMGIQTTTSSCEWLKVWLRQTRDSKNSEFLATKWLQKILYWLCVCLPKVDLCKQLLPQIFWNSCPHATWNWLLMAPIYAPASGIQFYLISNLSSCCLFSISTPMSQLSKRLFS